MFRNSVLTSFIALALASGAAWADSAPVLNLNYNADTSKVKVIKGVQISDSGTIVSAEPSDAKKEIELTTVGSGLRAKKKTIWINVYVAQLLVSDPAHFDRSSDKALEIASKMDSFALQLQFVWAVDGPTVVQGFREGLQANGFSTDSGELKGLLDQIASAGDASNHKTLTIIGQRLKDGSETITFENSGSGATFVTKGANLIRPMLSIWLGNPADDGLAKLKAQLLAQ